MNKFSFLALIGLSISFAGLNVNSSIASETVEKQNQDILISQLRGHDTYSGGSQINWQNYTLGRVIAKSGGWMSIKVEDGSVFQAEGFVRPGSNVLVSKNEAGEYYLVSASEAEWISILAEEYGWKRYSGEQASLNSRTAAIWQEIEASSQRTTTVIPQREVVQTETKQVETYNEPVRGLW